MRVDRPDLPVGSAYSAADDRCTRQRQGWLLRMDGASIARAAASYSARCSSVAVAGGPETPITPYDAPWSSSLVIRDVDGAPRRTGAGATRGNGVTDWSVVFDGAEAEGVREALCTLGNGYLATRGAVPEHRADGYHYPGTYLAGCYNRPPGHGSAARSSRTRAWSTCRTGFR